MDSERPINERPTTKGSDAGGQGSFLSITSAKVNIPRRAVPEFEAIRSSVPRPEM